MKKELVLIFVLALTLRMTYLLSVPPRPMNTMDDSAEWNNTAMRFLHGEGFLTHTENLDSKRPPLYPLFIAANYFTFGVNNHRAVKISQSILNSLSCLLVYAIGVLLWGRVTALAAGILCAAYPPFIVYTEILQSEIFFTFLLTLFSFLWIFADRTPRWKYFILTGISLGLLNLTRGTMILFPAIMLFVPFFIKEKKINVRHYGVLVFISLMIVAPWSWRNFKVYNLFIPIASGGTESFWWGTLPLRAQRQFGESPEFRQLQVPPTIKEVENYFKRLALRNIKNDPLNYAVLTIKKFIVFLARPIGHEIISKKSVFLGWVSLMAHVLLLILSVNGIFQTRASAKSLAPIYLLIVYFIFLHTLLVPVPRYRLPVEPFLILLSVIGIERAWKKEGPKKAALINSATDSRQDHSF